LQSSPALEKREIKAMSLSGTYEVIISALGVSIQGINQPLLASEGIEPVDVVLPVAKPVSSWVKTDANTAAGNLPANHGLTDGKMDVFWTGGRRYGVDGTIATNAFSLEGGAGDDFPASADETVVICPQTSLDVSFDGDNLVLIGAIATRAGLLLFRDSGGALIGNPVDLLANVPWGWGTGRGANPLSGNAVASATVSNASAEETANFKMTGLQHAV
jgi:hypothetical protein